MHRKLPLILSCWVLFVSTGCVSINEYMEAESQLKKCNNQLAQTDENLKTMQAELLRSEERVKILEARLKTSEEIGTKFYNDLSDLQTQNVHLEKLNKQLVQNNEKLQRDVQKQKSVLVLQEKVIQLLDDTKKTIESSLKDQIAAKDIEVVESNDQLKMVLVDTILFESGSTKLSEEGKALLSVIAKSIKDYKNQRIVVEGHTDNKPIKSRLKNKFPSNWELSAVRASAVVRFLELQGMVDPQRLSAQGYSYYHPVASNQTEQGRRQNRRIEIILSPQK
ncbi:MAG: OmpA family protein [Desulfobacterales bacterium]|nr:MAG: OmpA family protein [Desulfobacterales bacterium]